MGTVLGIRTVSSMMQTKLVSQDKAIKKQTAAQVKRKAATRKFGARLAARTKRVAARSIAAIPTASIPFIGVAVLIADTGYELYATCETVRDLDQLYSGLGMTDEVQGGVIHNVCDPELPDAGELLGWGCCEVWGVAGSGQGCYAGVADLHHSPRKPSKSRWLRLNL
ncbi:MAG: hypothetical protein V7754_00035 [Halioglobus sp.]